MTRKKLLEAGSILAALLAVMLISLAYFQFAFQRIYQKSVNHPKEIYTQGNSAFCFTLKKNGRLLLGWRNNIRPTTDTTLEKRLGFLQEEKESWYFTAFCLLLRYGQSVASQGDTNNPDRRENLRQLVGGQENSVMDDRLPAGQFSLFPAPIKPERYWDSAVGIGFHPQNMAEVLRTHAISDKNSSSGGRTLLSPQSEKEPDNFLVYLRGRLHRFRDYCPILGSRREVCNGLPHESGLLLSVLSTDGLFWLNVGGC